MSKRYIRKRDFNRCRIRLSKDFISNGHWMLRRDRIVGGELFTVEILHAVFADLSAYDVDEELVAQAISADRSIEFHDTGWRKGDAALLLSKDQKLVRFVNPLYLELIDMDECSGLLYGSNDPKTALGDTDHTEPPSFVLMPLRVESSPGGVEVIRALVIEETQRRDQ